MTGGPGPKCQSAAAFDEEVDAPDLDESEDLAGDEPSDLDPEPDESAAVDEDAEVFSFLIPEEFEP